ncbi:signal peptidase I [Pseudonocardiaceae bacterium YIM PH 21723]|nr:signal peptidase I [Pseudonocardiaceae bacterium YIM PH 21723]
MREPVEESSQESQDQPSQDEQPKKQTSFWKELPILIVTALVLTIVIRSFIALPFRIPSPSMEQTLHGCTGCVGDRVLVDRITYLFRPPQPGDVVVFHTPERWRPGLSTERSDNKVVSWFQDLGAMVGLAADDPTIYIKRVIAVGGQTVQCCDAENRVLVDGKALNEPYLYFQPGLGDKQLDFAPVKIPDGQMWLMGDNRRNSSDSSFADHGPVPMDNVIGKARLIMFPFGRLRLLPDDNPQVGLVLLAVLPAARRRLRQA